MPNLQKIPFAISSAESFSRKNNDALLLNMFVHVEEEGGKSNHILINTCGLEIFKTLTDNILGIYEFKEDIFVVTETKFYQYDTVYEVFNELGTVSLNKRVKIADNGIDIVFVGGNGYSYTPSTGVFKSMEQDGWYPADTVTYMDGYFIFNRTGTGQFFISQLYSTVIDPIDWASAESAPDDTVAVIVANRQLWIMGERSTEVWYDSGDPDFPFTRISGAVGDVGCLNYQTVAKIRDSIFYVGDDYKVYATSGYASNSVSTSAIEYRLSRADKNTLYSFSYHMEGHWFYVLTIDNQYTFVYDILSSQWHSMKSSTIDKWKINNAINFYSSGTIFGTSGNSIYKMSIDYLDEDGDSIRREAISTPVNKTVNRLRVHEVRLDMEVGFNTPNAEVILRTSKDGGVTWSNNHYAYTGNIGENLKKLDGPEWDNLET